MSTQFQKETSLHIPFAADVPSRSCRKYAGKDATEEYSEIHAPDVAQNHLAEKQQLGPLVGPLSSDAGPSQQSLAGTVDQKLVGRELTPTEMERRLRMERRPPLSAVFNLHDFEAIAKAVMEPRGWAYYSSGADDEVTMRENHQAYSRVFFRPRVLRDVVRVLLPLSFALSSFRI